MIYVKRLERLEDNRLVAEKLKETGNVEWWREYGVLLRSKEKNSYFKSNPFTIQVWSPLKSLNPHRL